MNLYSKILISLQNTRYKYIKSFFGFFWLPISFFILIFIKTLLFTDILNLKIDKYIPHIGTGLLFWSFISNSILNSLNIFFNNKIILNLKINSFDYLQIHLFETTILILLNSISLYIFF